MELNTLLPPGAQIRKLPNTHKPRLYMMGLTPRQRWQESALFPAFRWTAQMYRLFLRVKAASGLCSVLVNGSQPWMLKEFVESSIPNVCSVVVLIGTQGPAQKIIVQLWDERKVVGYLKYAEKPAARIRLKKEYQILRDLPKGLAPIPLKYGPLGEGEALLSTPVFGRMFSAKLPPVEKVITFFNGLRISAPLLLEAHPWVQMYAERNEKLVEPWLEALSRRKWSIVFSHGDSAPWNIFDSSNGNVIAIDWEYGTNQGFPHLDVAQYILQVAALIYRWSPQKAKTYAIDYLSHNNSPLSKVEAQSVVCLSAYHAYVQALEDGHSLNASLQSWRRTVWES